MKIPKPWPRARGVPGPARKVRRRWWSAARDAAAAVPDVRSGATTLIERLPGTVDATWAGAQGTTRALQVLPDSTLRWLAASSLGLGTGFFLAGAPRLLIAAVIAPALMMGAAIALRPIEPTGPA